MEPGNILPYVVQVRRPPFTELVCPWYIPCACQVVDESVKPHINHLLIINFLRKRNAPSQGGSGHAYILESFLNPVHYLIPSGYRHNKLGVFSDVPEQRLLKLGQSEEVVGLLYPLRFSTGMKGTLPVNEVPLFYEPLTRDTIVPGVGAFVDVASFIRSPYNVLNSCNVIAVCRPDESVVADVKLIPCAAKVSCHDVTEFFCGKPFSLSLPRHIETVLISACQEKSIVSGQSLEPSNYVRSDFFISMPQVRVAVHIIYCGCNIELSQWEHPRLLPCTHY